MGCGFEGIPDKKTIFSYSVEADGLLKTGIQTLAKTDLGKLRENDISHKEYCINSTLHRGCYHPSPVYDLIVGNTTRGKISTNPHNSRITHHYYYNQEEKLVYIESIYMGKISRTEYLLRDGNIIYGYTIDSNGYLSAVTKEIYNGTHIIEFSLLHCFNDGQEYHCFDYLHEQYLYDEDGLHFCHFIKYVPNSVYLIDKTYVFERKDGFLFSYSEYLDTNTKEVIQYRIRKKRKA